MKKQNAKKNTLHFSRSNSKRNDVGMAFLAGRRLEFFSKQSTVVDTSGKYWVPRSGFLSLVTSVVGELRAQQTSVAGKLVRVAVQQASLVPYLKWNWISWISVSKVLFCCGLD